VVFPHHYRGNAAAPVYDKANGWSSGVNIVTIYAKVTYRLQVPRQSPWLF